MKKALFVFLILLSVFSCNKKQEEIVEPTYNITLRTHGSMYKDIPVILTNGLDYFKADTFNVFDGVLEYSGVSDSVLLVIFRFPEKDINLYVSSGDTLDVTYLDNIIKVSGGTVNDRLYEFYRKQIYYLASLKNMQDTMINYTENPEYKRIRTEWRGKVSEYVSENSDNLTAQILLKENLQYFDESSSISGIHKNINIRYPIVSKVITNYIIASRIPTVRSKIISFTLRNEYKKTDDKGKSKKNFNIFDNNGSYNIITFWSYKDSLSVERVKDLAAIEKKYKGKKLSFVTISLDSDVEEWKSKVDKYKIPGRNFILTKGLGYDVPQRLGVNTVPYNIIINDKLIINERNIFEKNLLDFLKDNVKK